jgi:hypothetical protein
MRHLANQCNSWSFVGPHTLGFACLLHEQVNLVFFVFFLPHIIYNYSHLPGQLCTVPTIVPMRHDTTKVTFDPWLLEDVDWISEDANCLLSRGAWHTTPPGLNHLLQCAQHPPWSTTFIYFRHRSTTFIYFSTPSGTSLTSCPPSFDSLLLMPRANLLCHCHPSVWPLQHFLVVLALLVVSIKLLHNPMRIAIHACTPLTCVPICCPSPQLDPQLGL